jgi:hypothetical protein
MIINTFKTSISQYGGGDIFDEGFGFTYSSKDDYYEIIVWNISIDQLDRLKTQFEWISEQEIPDIA